MLKKTNRQRNSSWFLYCSIIKRKHTLECKHNQNLFFFIHIFSFRWAVGQMISNFQQQHNYTRLISYLKLPMRTKSMRLWGGSESVIVEYRYVERTRRNWGAAEHRQKEKSSKMWARLLNKWVWYKETFVTRAGITMFTNLCVSAAVHHDTVQCARLCQEQFDFSLNSKYVETRKRMKTDLGVCGRGETTDIRYLNPSESRHWKSGRNTESL